MSATPRRFTLCLLVALTVLTAAPAGASPFDAETLLGKLRGFLSVVWAEVGCQVDPWGACTPNLGDFGGGGDLAGRIRAPRTDTGCMSELDGRCKTILADHGCEIDPIGACRN